MIRQLLANNSAEDWAMALFAACMSMLVLQLLRTVVLHRLKRVADKTATRIDDFFMDVLSV